MSKSKKAATPVDHRREFSRTFEELAWRHDRHCVFSDFVEMSAIALNQGALRSVGLPVNEADEAGYLNLAGRYDKEEVREHLPSLFNHMVRGMERDGGDWLGSLYGELGLCNGQGDQFFTPGGIAKLITDLTCGEAMAQAIREKSYVTVNEPAAGAGGMILALAESMKEAGHNPARTLFVVADEISHATACMCYVQMALWGIPGLVRRMNTLTRQKYWERYTPVYFLENWQHRLSVTGEKRSPEGRPVAASGKTKQQITNVKKESIRKK